MLPVGVPEGPHMDIDYLAVTREFYETNAEPYASTTAQMFDSQWLERFSAEVRPGGRILDVGCAAGRDSGWFAGRGFSVDGIDLSPTLISLAEQAVPSARFKVMNFLDLDFPEQTFDGIWCSCVLLHVPRAVAPDAVALLASRLRPAGFLYLLVKEGQREGIEEDSRYHNALKFSSYFENFEIRDMLKAADLEIAAISDLHKRVDNYRASERIFALARRPDCGSDPVTGPTAR
jgi:SAM-dependent methyltransferase